MAPPNLRSFVRSITVEPVLLFFMLGCQMEYGVYQDLIYHKLCYERYNFDRVLCRNLTGDALDYVQTQTSYWLQYNNIALMVPAIVAAFYLGSWGDRYGRKIPMIISNLSTLLGYLVLVFISTYERSPVALTLLSNFVCGLGGGYLMVMASVMSYLADITTKETRTTRVAILASMSVLGNTLGPFISGYLLEGTSYGYTFLFCIACNAFVIFYIVLRIQNVIPGTKQVGLQPIVDHSEAGETSVNNEKSEEKTKEDCGCDLAHIYKGMASCFKKRDGNLRTYIMFILVSCLCVFSASDCE